MPNDDVYRSLDNYLDSALEILSKWGQWLSEHERHVLESGPEALLAHAAGAEQLHGELVELSERRSELLALAHAAGFECSTLKQLAQTLPQWHQPEFRARVKSVERSMANLRRLSTAAWLLVNQCSRVVNEAMLLMTQGSTMQSVYVAVPHADTSGGQILDTEM